MKTVQKQSLIEYLDAMVAEGKEVSMGWEGGGDSGWCWFEIDGEQVSDSAQNSHIRSLLDHMYDELDYGSWAGEFSASGKAIYDSEEKAFVGTDHYSEDDTIHYDCKLEIRIPKSLWFDRMEIQIQEEDADVDSVFHVRNGFLTEEHDEFIEKFNNSFHKDVWAVIERFMNDPQQNEYRSMWESYNLNRSEFTEQGDFMVYTIEELGIGSTSDEEKEIYLELENITVNDEE